ncbi:hypothetical protein [Streptomyces poriferorum]|nr:hypothetical protein [Streptomyces poriferorum]
MEQNRVQVGEVYGDKLPVTSVLNNMRGQFFPTATCAPAAR